MANYSAGNDFLGALTEAQKRGLAREAELQKAVTARTGLAPAPVTKTHQEYAAETVRMAAMSKLPDDFLPRITSSTSGQQPSTEQQLSTDNSTGDLKSPVKIPWLLIAGTGFFVIKMFILDKQKKSLQGVS